jgi:hypothetical protein
MDAGGLFCILSLAHPKGHAVCGVRIFSSMHERSVCGPEYYTVWHSAVNCQQKKGFEAGNEMVNKKWFCSDFPQATPQILMRFDPASGKLLGDDGLAYEDWEP